MNERYFEDLKVGERFVSGPYIVTQDSIINFAREFDPSTELTARSTDTKL